MRVIWSSWGVVGLAGLIACGQPKTASDVARNADEATPPASGSGSGSGAALDADQPPMPVTPSRGSIGTTTPATLPTSSVPYDREAVEVVLRRGARQVKANCGAATDEDGKAAGPWGKTTVTVKLGHNGHSQGATVTPTFEGKPVGKCIAQAFAILTFPPFAGPDTTVDWEVEVVKPPNAQ